MKHYHAWYRRDGGSAFVPCSPSVVLDDILCEQFERTVSKDNCVSVNGLVLQIPADRHRYHYIKARVKVARHTDGTRISVLGRRQKPGTL